MAATVHVILFLFLLRVVHSEFCYDGSSYFFCCGDCMRSYHYGYQKCKADNNFYYLDTYDCYHSHFTYVYNTIPVGTIVGIVVGSLAGLGILITIIVCVSIHCCCRRTSTPGQVLSSGQTMQMTVLSNQVSGNRGTPGPVTSSGQHIGMPAIPNATPTNHGYAGPMMNSGQHICMPSLPNATPKIHGYKGNYFVQSQNCASSHDGINNDAVVPLPTPDYI